MFQYIIDKQSANSLSQMYSTKFNNTQTNKKYDLLPSIFLNKSRNNYKSSIYSVANSLPKPKPHEISQSSLKTHRNYMINYGKFDSMKSLEHFDKPKDSNTFSKLTISSRSLATNVKYNPTETSREIMKATMNLQMKKFADIKWSLIYFLDPIIKFKNTTKKISNNVRRSPFVVCCLEATLCNNGKK